MAYTLSQFISQAQSGGGVLLTKPAGSTKVVIKIGTQSIELQDVRQTVSVSGGVKTVVNTAANTLDLGTLFTANQVLESLPLRQAVSDGTVLASAGTAALSSMVVNQ